MERQENDNHECGVPNNGAEASKKIELECSSSTDTNNQNAPTVPDIVKSNYTNPMDMNSTEYKPTGQSNGKSPVSSQMPLSVVCTRPVNETEYKEVQKAVGKGQKNSSIVFSLLYFVIALESLMEAKSNGYVTETVIILVLSFFIFVGALLWSVLLNKQMIQHQFELYCAVQSPETVIEFYRDRVVSLSDNKQVVLYYKFIRKVIETPCLLVLMDEKKQSIVLRSEDMIFFDIQTIKQILYPRVPFANKVNKGAMRTVRQQPLSIPIFDEKPEPLMMVPVNVKANLSKVIRKYLIKWILMLLSSSLVLGILFSNLFWLTIHYWLDVSIFFALNFFVIGILICIFSFIKMRSVRSKKKQSTSPYYAALTEKGIAVCEKENHWEIPWGFLQKECTVDTVFLKWIWKNKWVCCFDIPLDQVSDRTKLMGVIGEYCK